MSTNITIDAIDAVITWVDGNDKYWQKKVNKYAKPKIDFKNKKNSCRYNSIGEINIAIRSIIKFAPFVRNIYLITDSQTPRSFANLQKLAEESNINLILLDHKIVFKDYEHYLPCFNSCSIGTVVFRIPGLSEHFILFNDDTFLMRKTQPKDFFVNGNPIIRGKWEKFKENRKLRKIYYKFQLSTRGYSKENNGGYKTYQQKSAKMAGMPNYLRRFHTPVSIRKTTLEFFFKKNANYLKENIQHRFRHDAQFIISSLSEHLEIKKKTYSFNRETQLTYFRSYKIPIFVKLKLYYFLLHKKNLFMTFQSLELADEKTRAYIFKWIEERLNS